MHGARGKRQLGAGGACAREWAHALTDDRVANTVCGAADGTRGRHSHGFHALAVRDTRSLHQQCAFATMFGISHHARSWRLRTDAVAHPVADCAGPTGSPPHIVMRNLLPRAGACSAFLER
eukprot:scaffold122779_cov63-Phaeocystis_antarctica.AAC.2